MSETTILLVIMAGLGLIEIFLILSVWKLIFTMEKINSIVKKFENKVDGITDNIKMVYNVIKPASALLDKGELSVHGKTPLGDVNLQISLGGKEQESQDISEKMKTYAEKNEGQKFSRLLKE